MQAKHELRSDSCSLTPFEKSDISQDYSDWLNDPAINKYLELRHTTWDKNKAENYVDEMNASDSSILFKIICNLTGQHIGNIQLRYSKKYKTFDLEY